MRSLWIPLALATVVGLSTAAILNAEPPLVPPVNPSSLTPYFPGNSNVIQGSGNGFGNTIIVGNSGSGSSSTVISNTRNGVGNTVVIVNDGKQVVVEDPPCYSGKNNAFWTTKVYCDAVGCTVYYSAKNGQWFRYVSADDCYRRVPPSWLDLIGPDEF